MSYVEVALPDMPKVLTYSAPFVVALGDMVRVPLRAKKASGVVLRITDDKPAYAVKDIEAVTEREVLTVGQRCALRAMHEYYGSHLGRSLRLFLPVHVEKTGLPKSSSPLRLPVKPLLLLSPEQERVLLAWRGALLPVLLHGITGSGKTELYLRMILETVRLGSQALLLVPEIALTPQLVAYMEPYIGTGSIACIHSDLSDKVRRELFLRIASGSVRLVIGSRSALFAPLRNLGLIILDEEHEWTYKSEQDPKYHARTLAQTLAKASGAKLVLGSATPSFESFAAARAGKALCVTLAERAGGAALPRVRLVDMRHEVMASRAGMISESLREAIQERLTKREQVILLHNRRGFSSSLLCSACGHTETCPDCNIPFTYHKKDARLVCHACGLLVPVPLKCSACGSPDIQDRGIGTEKLEREMGKLFPRAKIARLDRDSANAEEKPGEILREFTDGDILVGTQMVAKGLHFPRVTLSAVLLAESSLGLPDFRAAERSFALFMQLAGRSGRGDKAGEVLIQTFDPDTPLMRALVHHDYAGFFDAEYASRKQFGYPPARKMARLEVTGKTPEAAEKAARELEGVLMPLFPSARVIAAPAVQEKRRGQYVYLVQVFGADPRKLAEVTLPRSVKLDIDPVQMV